MILKQASPTNLKKKRCMILKRELKKEQQSFMLAATLYYMHYKDQLVLTGKINDVGAYTRTNIPNSYRAGIELQGGYVFN